MKQYFDLDKKQLVNPPGQGGVIRSVSVIRGDIDPIEIVFLKAGEEVTGVTNIVAVIKEKPGELEPSLADCQTWVEGESSYTGELALTGTALNTLIAAKTSIALLFEITCHHNGQGPITAQPVKCTVTNDLWRGTEDTPLEESTPDEWLEARRPAPLIRTAAQGPPVNEVLAVAQVETATVIAPAGCTSNGTYIVTVVSGSPASTNIALTTATHTTAALIAAAIRAGLSANSAITAHSTVSGTGANIVLTKNTAAANDASYNIILPGELGITAALTSTNTTAGVAHSGTAATARDQSCIVGDAGLNKLKYSAVQINPTQWQLVTAGVIWNETDEHFEKLVARDGTLQTDLYSLD